MFGEIFRCLIRFKVGDGRSARFWQDSWCVWMPLTEVFPNIFKLTSKKYGNVSEFVISNADGHQSWDLRLPHRLSNMENTEATDLVFVLLLFYIEEVPDQLQWRDRSNTIVLWSVIITFSSNGFLSIQESCVRNGIKSD